MQYDTRVITAKDILEGGYDTRVVTPFRPCPKCRSSAHEVIGAQCTGRGVVFGEYRCKNCGEVYGQPMTRPNPLRRRW